MTLEHTPDGKSRFWKPTKDFYLSDPRSAKLREVSLAVVKCLLNLLHVPEVAGNPDRQHDIYIYRVRSP